MKILHYQKKSTHLNTIERFNIRVEYNSKYYFYDSHTIFLNRIFDTLLKICHPQTLLTYHISVFKMGSKHVLLHMKKSVCLRSTYILFVQNMCSKYDVRELNDNELNMVSNMTHAKRRNSSIKVALNTQCAEYVLEKWLRQTAEIR